MIERSELKSRAKIQLTGHWKLAVLTCLVYTIIIQASSIEASAPTWLKSEVVITLNIIGVILYGPIQVGLSRFILKLATRESKAKFKDLFSGFDVFLKSLLMTIIIFITILIGTIVLIVPGVIATLMFSQSYYILAENPNLSVIECLKRSYTWMKGFKGELFILELSFIGWIMVCIFTLGIGFLWYTPYYEMTIGNFYIQLKKYYKEEYN